MRGGDVAHHRFDGHAPLAGGRLLRTGVADYTDGSTHTLEKKSYFLRWVCQPVSFMLCGRCV
jgi:hypothetical protein